MAWNAPITWTAAQLVSQANLNEQIRDNLLELKNPATTVLQQTATFTTTSASYVDIDASLSLSITLSASARILLVARLTATVSGGTGGYIKWLVDGSPIFQGEGLMYSGPVLWTDVLSAGAHTIKPQWYATGGFTNTTTVQSIVLREVS